MRCHSSKDCDAIPLRIAGKLNDTGSKVITTEHENSDV